MAAAVACVKVGPPWFKDNGRPAASGPGVSGGAGAELQGKARHVCWILIFILAGVLRLLLLLLWADQRTPRGDATTPQAWRVILLLHAVLLASLSWQYPLHTTTE